MTWQQRRRFYFQLRDYYWEGPYLYRECVDHIIRRCVMEFEVERILTHCHTLEAGGHHGAVRTAAKVLQCRLYWLTIFADAYDLIKRCDSCQRSGNISKRN